jgi:hypothetical protein
MENKGQKFQSIGCNATAQGKQQCMKLFAQPLRKSCRIGEESLRNRRHITSPPPAPSLSTCSDTLQPAACNCTMIFAEQSRPAVHPTRRLMPP